MMGSEGGLTDIWSQSYFHDTTVPMTQLGNLCVYNLGTQLDAELKTDLKLSLKFNLKLSLQMQIF